MLRTSCLCFYGRHRKDREPGNGASLFSPASPPGLTPCGLVLCPVRSHLGRFPATHGRLTPLFHHRWPRPHAAAARGAATVCCWLSSWSGWTRLPLEVKHGRGTWFSGDVCTEVRHASSRRRLHELLRVCSLHALPGRRVSHRGQCGAGALSPGDGHTTLFKQQTFVF